MSPDDDPIVKLNIGGRIFQTRKSTLTKCAGMLKVMMETEIPVTKDESGAIFIDRSPEHFEQMLNFLRDGELEIAPEDVASIQKEAHYYLLEELVEYCGTKIAAGNLKNSKSLAGLKIIDTDSQLLQIIANVEKPTLILHCPVTNFGSIQFPLEFDVNDFLNRYGEKLDVHFKPYKTESTVRYQEWQWTLYKKRFSKGNGSKDPRQSFGQHLEASVDVFLLIC